jgi:acetyltransferase-like isoleucine patch superfamily enzyme
MKLPKTMRTMNLSQQIAILLRFMRGVWHAPRFDRKRWILAGRSLHVEKRFAEIHLGDLVGFGSHIGIAVIGKSRSAKAMLRIGDHTHIGDRTHINCYHSINIGDHCAISWDVEILDTDIHTLLNETGQAIEHIAPVVIEDRVWIGAHAIILKGVTIGHDSVVAAGAVVTRSIPPFSVCAGNPATVVKASHGWIP